MDISIPHDATAAADGRERESSKSGLGKLEILQRIAAAAKGLVDTKTSA